MGWSRGGGLGGGRFWLHKETLTFKLRAAKQATAIYLIAVNKIPLKFDTLFATSLLVFGSLTGSLRSALVDILVAKS
jgi:hypothetical protein